MELDVREPGQVSGHAVLKADLGAGRVLVVLSGLAVPEFEINDDSTHREVCRLRLRESAGNLEQSTIHVGLASIGNDDTAWVFATDEATLVVDEAGELVLVTHLALMGEPSQLHRFSYQVVLTTRVVVTEITGTIIWPTALLRPTSTNPRAVSGFFTAVAYTRTTTPDPGPFGGVIEHRTPVAHGEILTVIVSDDTCRATYRIADPPKGQELIVGVANKGLNVTPPSQVAVLPVVQGGDRMTLSIAQPVAMGVDFIATVFQGPR